MSVTHEVKGNKVYFKTPYDNAFIEAIRNLKSRHYEGNGENSISIYNEQDIMEINKLLKKHFNYNANIDPKIAGTKPFGAAKVDGDKVIFKTVMYDEQFNSDLKSTFKNYHFNWNDHTWSVFIASNPDHHLFKKFLREHRIITRPEFDQDFMKIANRATEMKAKREELVKLSSQPTAPSTFTYNLPDPVLSLYPFQEAGVHYLKETNGNGLIADEMGLGKAQPLTSKILTPKGWKLMKDIELGEEIINAQGGINNVTGIFDRGELPVYSVEFTDGSSTECSEDHLWLINTPTRKFREQNGKVKRLDDIMRDLDDKNGNLKNYIPLVDIVEFYEQPYPIDPYILGLLLGDGCFVKHTPSFTTSSDELKNEIEKSLPKELSMKKRSKYDWDISGEKGKLNSVTFKLRELGLMGKHSKQKFIPNIYLINSSKVRLAIMQGLLDTDGYVSKDNTVQFTSVSIKLIQDIQFIIQSLGGTSRLHKKETTWTYKGIKKTGSCYYITIALPPGIQPFRLKRKKDKYSEREKYYPSRAIKKVTFVGIKECQCIRTNAFDQLYVTDDFIVTHNTIQSLVYLYNEPTKRPILAVVPNHVKLNWYDEIKKWLDLKDNDICYIEGLKIYDLPKDKQLYLINYDILYKWVEILIKMSFKSVIFDESHYLKQYKSKRTKAAVALSKKIDSKILLSGTPILNRPIEIWTTIQILGKEAEFGNVGLFAFKYCGAFRDERGHLIVEGASNVDELQVKLRSGIMIRRTKKDVLPDLPSKHRMVKNFLLDNQAEYDRVKNDFQKWYNGKTGKTITEAEAMVQIEMLKQACIEGKMKSIVKFIIDTVENDSKVVVVVHHRKAISEIEKELLKEIIPVFKVVGGETAEQKKDNVDKFNAAKKAACICSLKGGTTGINLQTASTLIFTEYGWTPGEHDQAEDRIHRIGQDHVCNIYYCIAPGTIDGLIWKILKEKREIIEKSTDGMIVENEKSRSFIKDVLDQMKNQ